MNDNIYKNDKIVITGGTGFLGSHLVNELKECGYNNVVALSSKHYDLCQQIDVRLMFIDTKPDILIHLAADVGGIEYNQKNPGSLCYNNLIMGDNIIEAERHLMKRLKKLVIAGTICAFPKNTPVPFKEEDLWAGYPEETNAPYGLAKKMHLVLLNAYREQYDTQGIYLLIVNLFGENDNFDPKSSHVIPALIKKIYDAVENNKSEVTVWGDGTATREFLYVKDCAKAVRLAMENYNEEHPINLGSGVEITIKELVNEIRCAFLTYYSNVDTDKFERINNLSIKFDASKPGGQPRRCLDVQKAKDKFGFVAETSLTKGLQECIQWYIKQINT